MLSEASLCTSTYVSSARSLQNESPNFHKSGTKSSSQMALSASIRKQAQLSNTGEKHDMQMILHKCMIGYMSAATGEEEDLDLGKMVREGEVAWLHKADMPGSGHAEHAEESNQQAWRAHKSTPHSPDQGASRKRKEPPTGQHSYPASRPASAHAGVLPMLPPKASAASAFPRFSDMNICMVLYLLVLCPDNVFDRGLPQHVPLLTNCCVNG